MKLLTEGLIFTIGLLIISLSLVFASRSLASTENVELVTTGTNEAYTSDYDPDPCSLTDVICEEENQEVIWASVTAYSEIDSCHYENCVMASGKRAYIGAVACPREISLGTRVIIDNTPYVCEDRTNLNLNGRYDIFFGYGKSAHTAALAFGKQKMEVQIMQ